MPRRVTRVESRGTACCWVLDNKGRLCEPELKPVFWVPTHTRNLISVKKLAEQSAMVSFEKEENIKTQNGTIFPLVRTSDDLYTLRDLLFVSNFGPIALPLERLPGIAHGSGGARVGHLGWVSIQPKAEPWCSGTGHWDTTISMMCHG